MCVESTILPPINLYRGSLESSKRKMPVGEWCAGRQKGKGCVLWDPSCFSSTCWTSGSAALPAPWCSSIRVEARVPPKQPGNNHSYPVQAAFPRPFIIKALLVLRTLQALMVPLFYLFRFDSLSPGEERGFLFQPPDTWRMLSFLASVSPAIFPSRQGFMFPPPIFLFVFRNWYLQGCHPSLTLSLGIIIWCFSLLQLKAHSSDTGFPSVCCEYHRLIEELLWAYVRATGEQS